MELPFDKEKQYQSDVYGFMSAVFKGNRNFSLVMTFNNPWK